MTAGPELPLSDRPLVSAEENTVITPGGVVPDDSDLELRLTATAQEIRDRLFAAPDSDSNPEDGLRIGHFEVEERIGSGGMGAVFRAVDLELSRYVALKVLHPGVAADPSLVARFRNEARACAQLNHDNLARVFYAGDQDGVYYIAYEFADGMTIKELISLRGTLTAEETVNYAIQATLALSHVDSAGIVHRDIKPSNIILTHQGRVKVVDLGLARRETNDSIGDLTVAGTTLGTFDYIAPEQARDPRTADIRSDIYSLGCTVYHMLTGQPPYPDGTALQKLLDHQGKSPPDPRSLRRDVPADLAAIVQQMMNTDPEKRYQDPGQLLADLLSQATHMGLKSVPAEGIVWRRMSVTRVRELSGALFLTGAVVVLCVTALIMHFAPAENSPPEEDLQAVLEKMLPRDPTPVQTTESTGTRTGGSEAEAGTETSETGTGNEASGTGQPTEPVAAPPFRVVRADRTEVTHLSLTEALGDATTGDEILLDFDGPVSTPTSSRIRLDPRAVQAITLRAVEGRTPVLEFRGEPGADRADQNQMFYLSNNLRLTMIGIDIRVDVPIDVPDDWTLFSCVGANQLRLQNCTIEVVNPSRRDAAVVLLSEAAGTTEETLSTSVSLENVAVRGSCDLFVVRGQTNAELSARQAAFALDGSLVRNYGIPRLAGSATAGPSGQINIVLDHITAVLAEPMIELRDSDGISGGEQERDLAVINVLAQANVFASLSEDGTFVRSRGNAYLNDMLQLLVWQGSFNLYHQYGYYWDLTSGSLDDDSDQFEFPDWLVHWQNSDIGFDEQSAEFSESPWVAEDSFRGRLRSELVLVDRESFELNRNPFYGTESGRYAVDETGALPGVNIRDLRRFPDVESSPVPEPKELDDDSLNVESATVEAEGETPNN